MTDFIDFRNARYQGELRDRKPHGIGITIDNNHLFCLAHWNAGKIDGPVFVVFPEAQILCGRMKGNRLSDLCCFYLPDHIQTYINYSKNSAQAKNFITVLPAYRLILEIDGQADKTPKVKRHQKYKEENATQSEQLERVFGSPHDMSQFKSWKQFVFANFIRPYESRFVWKDIFQVTYRQFFLAFKPAGLGIKIIEFDEEEDRNIFSKNLILVSAIGQFSYQQDLRGYGKKIIDLGLQKEVEQGQFLEFQKETVTYKMGKRPKEAVKLMNQHLTRSIRFEDTFLKFSLFYELQNVYSKINIEIVEETQKIAQVILHNNENSELILAEIQKKREKRRLSTNKNKEIENMAVLSSASKTVEEESKNINSSPEHENRLANPQKNYRDVEKSIYSSVEKIKHDPQKRVKAFQNFQKRYGIQTDPSSTPFDWRPQKRVLSKVNESPPPKNGISQERFKYNFQTLGSKQSSQPQSYLRRETSFEQKKIRKYKYDPQPPLYRHQQSFQGLKYLNLDSKQNYGRHNRNYVYRPLKNNEYEIYRDSQYKPITRQTNPYKQTFKEPRQHFYQELNRSNNISQEYQKIKEKEEQLSFFNKLLNESRQTQHMKSTVTANRSDFDIFSANKSQSRSKTPGKIRTTKIKRKAEQYQS